MASWSRADHEYRTPSIALIHDNIEYGVHVLQAFGPCQEIWSPFRISPEPDNVRRLAMDRHENDKGTGRSTAAYLVLTENGRCLRHNLRSAPRYGDSFDLHAQYAYARFRRAGLCRRAH